MASAVTASAQHHPFLNGVIGRAQSWRYTGGRRDLRLDLLRGFAAFAMIVDHLEGGRPWVAFVTGGDRFMVSAAEIFVFISGLVMGIVYSNVVARQGAGAGVKKALGRAGTP